MDRHIKFWLLNAADFLAERDPKISEEDSSDSRRMRALALARATARPSDLFDPSALLHAHGSGICDGDGTDLELGIAAEALDLPRWASRTIVEEGAMGSGYAQPAIVVPEGRSFEGLWKWLVRIAADQSRSSEKR